MTLEIVGGVITLIRVTAAIPLAFIATKAPYSSHLTVNDVGWLLIARRYISPSQYSAIVCCGIFAHALTVVFLLMHATGKDARNQKRTGFTMWLPMWPKMPPHCHVSRDMGRAKTMFSAYSSVVKYIPFSC